MRRSLGQMLIGNLLSAFLGAAVVVCAARFLRPELWAEAAIVIGVGPALGVVLSLGSVTYQIRELAKTADRGERENLVALFNCRRLVLAAPLSAFGVLILWLESNTVGLILLLGAIRFIRGGAGVLFSAERRFGWLSVFLVGEKFGCLLLVLGFQLLGHLSVSSVAASYLFSYVIFVALCMLAERPRVTWPVVLQGVRSPFRIWKGSGAFGITSLVGPAQQLDVSVVSFVVGGGEAGLFASASRMVGGLNFIGSALASVTLPYLASAEDRPKSIPVRVVVVCGTVGCLMLAATIIFAGDWVPFVLGEEYRPAVGAISAYIVAISVLTLNQPMMAALQARGYERFVMGVAFTQAFLGLLAVGAGAALGGATGAAIGYLCVTVLVLAVLSAGSRRMFDRH